MDTFSSNDPIENQHLQNINPTTNSHTNDNLLSRTSYAPTNNNQIEDLPHQNSDNQIVNNEVLSHQNNDNQIAHHDNLFYEQCDNCKRRQFQDAHTLYQLHFFTVDSNNIQLRGTFKHVKSYTGSRACDYTLCQQCNFV